MSFICKPTSPKPNLLYLVHYTLEAIYFSTLIIPWPGARQLEIPTAGPNLPKLFKLTSPKLHTHCPPCLPHGNPNKDYDLNLLITAALPPDQPGGFPMWSAWHAASLVCRARECY